MSVGAAVAAPARASAVERLSIVPVFLLGLGVAPVAAVQGGYFPQEWGWSALALLWLAGLAIALGSAVRLRALELCLVAALGLLCGWTLLSTLWATVPSQPPLEAERDAVYLAAAAAVLLLVRRAQAPLLLAGIWAGISLVCTYALLTRLLPERLGTFDTLAGYRLAAGLGYWNALGVFAAMGTLLAVGLAARSRTLAARALAGLSTVPLVLTLYFTFSRGGWISLFVGLVVLVALDPRRLQLATTLLAVAPSAALAVVAASHQKALTTTGASLAAATRQGHRLLLVTTLLALAAALAVAVVAVAERRVRVPRAVRRAYAGVLIAAAVLALVAVLVRFDGPVSIARKAYDSLNSAPVPILAGDLNQRLLTLSNNGRIEQWKVAWREARQHPVLGSGAGTYEQYWMQHRSRPGKVRDVHNLYLETLAELGPLGLALLLVALGVPLVAGVRARREALVPAATAAYVAYLFHAGVDWDWEVTAVTLAALGCGLVAVVAARRSDAPLRLGAVPRVAAVAAIAGIAAFSLVGLVGNRALASSSKAYGGRDWPSAEAKARRAIRWAPWSSDAWAALGWAQLAAHDRPGALVSFRKAVAKDPLDYDHWLSLAYAARGRERTHALARVSQLNPLLDLQQEFNAVERE